MSKYSIGLGGRRSNYIHRIHDSRLTQLPFSLDQLLSGYRGASRSASLRPDAHDPPLIRLVVEATRGSVKANTSATFSRSSPFICLLSTFLFLLFIPRFFHAVCSFIFFEIQPLFMPPVLASFQIALHCFNWTFVKRVRVA